MNKFQGQQMIHPCLEKFHMYKPEIFSIKAFKLEWASQGYSNKKKSFWS